MFHALGFGLSSAVLLVSFGELISDRWFAYTMLTVVIFQVLIFWLGLRRPLVEEDNWNADSGFEFLESISKHKKQRKLRRKRSP